MKYYSALLIAELCVSLLATGCLVQAAPQPIPLDCAVVLCAAPTCDNPIPANPAKGICCPICPGTVTVMPPNDDLVCPPIPPDSFGVCVNLCSGDDSCPSGQKCCSNGCGTVCKKPVPAATVPAPLPPSPTCPPGVPVFNCLIDPCQFAECPAHPNAQCVADYCGGCNARFYDSGNEVTDSCHCPVQGQMFTTCGSACPPNCTDPTPICTKQCVARCECPTGTVINEATNTCVPVDQCPTISTDTPPAPSPTCPPGVPVFNCLIDPCRYASCPAYPNAKCVADYCGGCNARFFDSGNEVTDDCASTPPTRSSRRSSRSTCPPGVPVFNCLIDPCRYASCPAYPNAKCVADYCGGCNARFFDSGNEVTDDCASTPPTRSSRRSSRSTCPPGVPVFNCLIDPCRYASCPAYPNAKCVADYCGGCNARFFDSGNEVTDNCASTPPTRSSSSKSTCPPGVPMVNCFVNPCQSAECPAHPNAQCVPDYCGGCNARFYDSGSEVTDSCHLLVARDAECPIPGQVFTECGYCPPTCSNPDPICTLQCVAGCQCAHGTVLNELTNSCVLPKQCPN